VYESVEGYRRGVKREIRAPDGTTWRVANRWYRRPRYRKLGVLDGLGDGLTYIDVPADDIAGILAAIVIGVVLTLVLSVLVAVLLPVVLFLLEVPIVLALVFVVRRLWIVEAISEGGRRNAWRVRGWLRARRAVAEVADELERGLHAEPDEALGPA
jgi:hypothetical protein